MVISALVSFALALRQRDKYKNWIAVTLSCAALTVAVITPPHGSQDVWSYAMYGRMVTHYHQSPYTHSPQEHPLDVLARRIPNGWQHVNSVYGPLFTGLSAGFAALTGTSLLAARLAQQVLEALSVVFLALYIRRAKPNSHIWLLLGLNPATIAIVNGGHNDLLTGALIGLGALYVNKRRLITAGALLAAAVLIKATAALAAVVIVAWLFKRQRRSTLRFATPMIVIVVAGYAMAGGTTAVKPLFTNAGYTSRAGLLAIPHHIAATLFGDSTAKTLTSALALITFVGLIGFWFGFRRTRQLLTAPETVGLTNSALIFASPYVLPWYCGWLLPTAAICEGTYTSRVAFLQSGLLLAAYSVPAGADTGVLVGIVSICALPVGLPAAALMRPGMSHQRKRLSSTE